MKLFFLNQKLQMRRVILSTSFINQLYSRLLCPSSPLLSFHGHHILRKIGRSVGRSVGWPGRASGEEENACYEVAVGI